MFELLAGSDAVRRQVKATLEPSRPRPIAQKPERRPRKRVSVRSTSAAALRSLADRVEPSPSA
jgi:hypothetical protein